jgi:hypothetical protein
MADPIVLKNAHGQLFDYDDEADARAAIANMGYQLASPNDVVTYDAAKKEREEFGTATQQALAAGELAVGSATFGLVSNDSEEAKARRRQLRKQSPFVAGGAEIAGALVPGAGVAGLAGKAVKAAGAVGRAGAIGVDVAADLTSGLSLESELAREQEKRIDIGNVVMWSLGGVAAENVVRAGFRGVKNFKNNVIPSAKTKAQQFRAGTATDELTDVETRAYVENFDEITNQVRTLGHDAGNSFQSSFDDAHSVYYKAEDVRGMIQSNPKLQSKFADETVERAEHLVDVLEARGSKKTADTIRRHIFQIEASADAADLFISGDQLKRTVQKYRKKASQAARQSGNDPFGDLVAEFDAVETPLRVDLEKPKIWGQEVAGKQSAENALWSSKNGYIHNAAIFQDAFYSRLPGSAATDYDGLPQFAWDDSKLQSFMQLDRIGQRDVLEAGEKMFKSAEEMIKVKEALGVRPADMVQLKSDLTDLRTTIDQVKKLTQARIKGADLMAKLARKGQGVRENVATAAGGVAGASAGPIGAAAGAGLARQLNDFFTPATIRDLDPLVSREVARDRLSGRVENLGKVGQPSSGLRNSGTPPMPSVGTVRRTGELTGAAMTQDLNDEDLAELSEHGRVFTERAASMMTSSGARAERLPDPASRFQGDFPTLRDAFDARKALLVDAAADPAQLIDHLSNSFGDLPDTHPGLFAGVAERVSRGVQYLLTNLPPSVGYSMRDPAGLPASMDAIREFARLWDAVFEPANVFHDIGTGRATPKQLRAIAEVHPDLFAQFQSQVLNKMSARLTPPPYESQRYVDQIMQLDGAYSPGLSKAVAKNIRNSMGSAPSNPEGLASGKLETSVSNPRGIASIASGPTSSS